MLQKLLLLLFCSVLGKGIAQISIEKDTIFHMTCFRAVNEGYIKINSIKGGTPPYQYIWSDGSQGDERKNLSIGKHTVTITDNSMPIPLSVTKDYTIQRAEPIRYKYHFLWRNDSLSKWFTYYSMQLDSVFEPIDPNTGLRNYYVCTYTSLYHYTDFELRKNGAPIRPVYHPLNYETMYSDTFVFSMGHFNNPYRCFNDSIRFNLLDIFGVFFTTYYPNKIIKTKKDAAPQPLVVEFNRPLDSIVKITWLRCADISKCGMRAEGYEKVNNNCKKCATLVPSSNTTAYYKAVVEDVRGYAASTLFQYYVEEDTIPPVPIPPKLDNVYLPTSFSPNSDGINDNFTVFGGLDVIEVVRMDIYDRWGAHIFHNAAFTPNDESFGWNGDFKNIPVPQGNYTYDIVIRLKDKSEKAIKGEVMVIR